MAGYTLLRQEDDIRKSDVYDDTRASTLANMETNATDLEYDMNSVRSVLSLFLDDHDNDWYTDLVTPSGLGDTGSRRGINDLNTDAHLLERKRVLVKAPALVDVSVGAATAASEDLDASGGDFANGETVTIGTTVYTMESAFSDTAYYVLIGGSVNATLLNLAAAINKTAGEGITYGTGTVIHPDVGAGVVTTTLTATAKKEGTFGNLVALAEASTNVIWTGAAVFLSGGAGGDVVILGAGELPPNINANVENTNTLGTMVATDSGTFGEASLEEIAGGNAIEPWNIVAVVDASTRDPMLTAAGTTIWGLLQGESGLADDDNILVTTPDRVQVTFVTINSTGDDLVTIDGADLGGQDVNLVFTEQKALFDLSKGDFLRGAVVDNISASGAVTRAQGYVNQSTTPVELTNNADLDLAASVEWAIRDAANADLLKITEDSSGGATTLLVGSDVDNYDNNAADNDFAAGAAFGSSGTEIAINETAGVIERASDLIMRASGAGELYFDDSWQPGSWAQTDGIKLSASAAEWAAWETAFGGEVSILNATVQAFDAAADPTVTWHEVQAPVAVDTDVGGPGTAANNLDVNIPNGVADGTITDGSHWMFANGRFMRPAADAAPDYDYYPGTTFDSGTSDVEIKMDGRKLKTGDSLAFIIWS